MAKRGYISIVPNKNRTTFYIGVTSNLSVRLYQHKNGEGLSFTKKVQLYRCAIS
jgi:putative endonuclease